MNISLIAAMGKNKIIGKGAKMPWNLPDELQYFMDKTRKHFVLMGRKTFEPYKQVMKNHKVIVVTSQTYYQGDYATVVHSVDEGIEIARQTGESELFIAGGGEIFKASMHLADRIYLTIIDQDFAGDVFFPTFDESLWKQVSKTHHTADDRHPFAFDFLVLEKK